MAKKIVVKKTDITQPNDLIIILDETNVTIQKLYCNNRGIIKKRFYRKSKKLSSKVKIIDVPIILNNIYITQNNERLYDLIIGTENYCFRKSKLLSFLEDERNYCCVSGRELKNCISIILREYEKVKKIIPQEAYPTIGIFLDKKNNLTVVYPNIDGIQIFGENSYQKRAIERTEKLGLDEKGRLTKIFYDLIHLKSIPEDVRLITIGHCVILPFFYVLKNFLDVFPYHFWIDPKRSIGKTTTFEIFYNYLFGTELKTPDDIDSPARATKNATAFTFALNIDDTDKLYYKTMNFMKVHGTRLKGRERMKKNQDLDIEETYACFVGTANSSEFLQGEQNEAFRGRCFISMGSNDINPKEAQKFEHLFDKIKTNKIYGSYLLQTAIDFINNSDSDPILSSVDKLKKLIKAIKKNIITIIEKKNITLIDTRRITMYSLIYIGWEIWNYLFNKHNLHSELLEKMLNDNIDNFSNLIIKYEEIDLDFIYQDFENVLAFFTKYAEKYSYYKTKEDDLILTTNFINDYDEWAKRKGYDILKHLSTLATMQSKLLKKESKVKTIRFYDTRTNEEFRSRGLIFFIDEIKQHLNISKDLSKRTKYTLPGGGTVQKKSKKIQLNAEDMNLSLSNEKNDELDEDKNELNDELDF